MGQHGVQWALKDELALSFSGPHEVPP